MENAKQFVDFAKQYLLFPYLPLVLTLQLAALAIQRKPDNCTLYRSVVMLVLTGSHKGVFEGIESLKSEFLSTVAHLHKRGTIHHEPDCNILNSPS